jgi:alkylhydroperoxidase family enzyme
MRRGRSLRSTTALPATAFLALAGCIGLAARAQPPLPDDVDADSRCRLPLASADLEPGIDAIIAHGSGTLIRWEFALGRPLSELAILTVARELDQPYEWSLHELEALAVGLDSAVIDVVRDRAPLVGLDALHAVIVRLGREIFGGRAVSSATYAEAESLLGRTNLVDIVMLMGEYAEDGVRLTAFNQQMPPGWRQFLPLPFVPPDDIHGDSRSRLPYLRRDTRPASATPSLYGRGLAPEGTGPGQITRRSRGFDALTAEIGPRLVHLVGLIAARELEDRYRWAIEAAAADASGLESDIVTTVAARGAVDGLGDREAALIEFGRELLTGHSVSAPTYARSLELFGQAALVDIVNLFAKLASDATLAIAFDQQPPADAPPSLRFFSRR